MGNNKAFTNFEATVLAVYNSGALTLPLLIELMEPYRGVDIDEGGMVGTLSDDGLDIKEIVIKTAGLIKPPEPELPEDYKIWTGSQAELHEDWRDSVNSMFDSVKARAGWR